jgi:hypothetical protein
MKHSIVLSPDLGLAVITLAGTITLADRARALDDFLAQAQGRDDIHGILVDLRDARSNHEPLGAASEYAHRLSTNRMLRRCRHAYVYSDAASANPVVETLAQALQFRFRRFNGMPEALDWLLMPRRVAPTATVADGDGPSLEQVLIALRRRAGFIPASRAA